jgi:hypothetical protein
MRRVAVVLLLVVVGSWPVASARARALPAAPVAAASLQADFDGDGRADLAVGAPFDDVGAVDDAGAVNVLYGSAGGLTGSGSQLLVQGSGGVGSTAEAGDTFGSTLAAGDFDGDGFADLAVGAPGENVGAIVDGGAVHVLYGSPGGLTGAGSQLFTQDSAGVGSSIEAGDLFGDALAAGDFDSDTFDDLAVGAPTDDVGSVSDGGAVNVLYGSAGRLRGAGSQLFTQDSAGVASVAEEGDFFGVALAAGDFDNDSFEDLAVGVAGEDVGATVDGGVVNALYGSDGGLTGTGSQLLTQDSPTIGSSAEEGDFFGAALAAGNFNGDAFDDLAIGAPLEAVVGVLAAGAVNVLPGSADKLRGIGSSIFTQGSAGVGGNVEAGDLFGIALAAGDFDSDSSADLAVGASGEAVGAVDGAGSVNVLYGSAGGPTGSGSQQFTQDTAGVPSPVEPGDSFGFRLSAGDYDNDGADDLAVGAPFEDAGSVVDAGSVNVLPGSPGGLTGAGSQQFTQDTAGVASAAEAGDRFGDALASSGPQHSTAAATAPSARSATRRAATP